MRHIQRLLLETFRADSPDIIIISCCRFHISGCWQEVLRIDEDLRVRWDCSKTVSETDDSRPVLLFCRPIHASSLPAFFEMQPDISSPTFFEMQHNAPTAQPSPELIIFYVSVRWGRFCVTKWKPYVTASLWDGPLLSQT